MGERAGKILYCGAFWSRIEVDMKAQKKDIQDLYFMANRYNLLEIAAFLDRVERHDGEADFRHPAFLRALEALQTPPPGLSRTQAVHHALSDHSTEPLEQAGVAFAYGAVYED